MLYLKPIFVYMFRPLLRPSSGCFTRILIKLHTAVPLHVWSGPEGSRKLRFQDFMTAAQGGGKVVSLTHRPHLPQKNLLVLISVRG